jgi:hypothetical protein
MSQHYSNPDRASDPHALPNIEVFQLTATEVAGMDDDMVAAYMQRREFRLAAMNSRVREAMLDAIVANEGIEGGFFYWYCFPGCMPDSEPMGPYASHDEALKAAQDDAAE